jgi:D-beta-D-heptose 7-phosphate kinase / D-beta-D-heptose 1-phosphate adenosyltransferase
MSEIAERRRSGQKIVFTNGCFDLFHIGHLRLLQEAATLGDLLIVAINSDAGVKQLKGEARPIIPENDRAAMIAVLPFVDNVIIFDDPTPHRLLEAIRPDVLVKGGTYAPDEVVGHEIIEAYGGQVHLAARINGVSTTRIIERLTAASKWVVSSG